MNHYSKTNTVVLVLCVLAISLLGHRTSRAEWVQEYPITSLSKYGDVSCVAQYNGTIVVGGYFSKINGKPAASVALFDKDEKNQWIPLGAGFKFQGGTARINDLIVYDGLLVAAGTFDQAGEVLTRGVAIWDGESWQDMDGGTTDPFVGNNSSVSALMIYDGALIAGGNFTGIGDVTTNNVARWSEGRWKALDSGTPQIVHCLTEFQGHLYAGGATTCLDPMDPLTGNAAWVWTNGAWSPFALECAGIGVFALADFNGTLVAGGVAFFTGNGLAYFDGSSWEEFGGGVSNHGEVRDLEVLKGNLIVSGTFDYVNGNPTYVTQNVARWDGGEWHDLDYGLWSYSGTGMVRNLLLDGDRFLAAGVFDHAGAPPGTIMLGLATWLEETIEIDQKSVTALQIPDLSGKATWNFSWKTSEFGDPWLDKVVVRDCPQTGPDCMIGEQVFIHNEMDVKTNVTELPDGRFLHEMTVTRNECSPGCDYSFDVSSTADDGYIASSLDNAWNTGYCIQMPPPMPAADNDKAAAPGRNTLDQNRPNPFNPNTVIGYEIASDANVRLAVYDVTGKLVRTLVNEFQGKNVYRVTWDGRDNAGAPVASGAYFYRLETPTFTQTRKLLLLK